LGAGESLNQPKIKFSLCFCVRNKYKKFIIRSPSFCDKWSRAALFFKKCGSSLR
jgi:hypothetical protein